MKSNEQQQKDLLFVVKNIFNTGQGRWIFRSSDLQKELEKLSSFEGFANISQFISNAMMYYEKKGLIMKTHEKATYFGFIKSKFPLLNDYNSVLNKAKNNIKVSDSIVKLMNYVDDNIIDGMIGDINIFEKESLFSTIIENSTLTEENFNDRKEIINDQEIIEVDNIYNAYRWLESIEIKPLDDIMLRNIHSRLFKGIIDKKRISDYKQVGQYAEKQNYISGGYLPCEYENKLSQLKEFIKFFNEKPENAKDAIYRISLVSYWFAGIHIFGDGNSRTGRLLLSYYMKLHNITKQPSFFISRSLKRMGGKIEFINAQGNSWELEDPTAYMKWFIEDLLELIWVRTMKECIN